jgi:hypothetical protein
MDGRIYYGRYEIFKEKREEQLLKIGEQRKATVAADAHCAGGDVTFSRAVCLENELLDWHCDKWTAAMCEGYCCWLTSSLGRCSHSLYFDRHSLL